MRYNHLMKTLSSSTLLFFFLTLTVAPLFGADDKDWTLDLKTSTLIPKYVGTVKELKGDVMVEDRFLQKGSKIYPRDIVRTQEKSFIKLELIDDSLITLGASSEFSVEQWAYRTKNDRDAVFSLIKGKMRAEIKSKSKERDQLKVRSPLVALGIRGTALTLNNTFQGTKEITQVALLEGKVQLLIEELKEKMDLKPGDYIEIVKGVSRTKHKSKKMPDEDFNALKQAQLPDQYNLMKDAELDTEDETNESSGTQTQSDSGEENSSTNLSNPAVTSTGKTIKPASLKEKIKILNTTREENLKK